MDVERRLIIMRRVMGAVGTVILELSLIHICTVGGMRASIYNEMPKEGVEKLVEFMKKFEKENA